MLLLPHFILFFHLKYFKIIINNIYLLKLKKKKVYLYTGSSTITIIEVPNLKMILTPKEK